MMLPTYCPVIPKYRVQHSRAFFVDHHLPDKTANDGANIPSPWDTAILVLLFVEIDANHKHDGRQILTIENLFLSNSAILVDLGCFHL